MQVIVNGKPTPAPPGATLAALVEALQLGGKRLAIERNGEIVPRSRYPQTALADADRIEIIHAVGGG